MPPDIAQLSLWQVERALASLSHGEKIALIKIARLYARKTPYDKEGLVQEAFARVLSGRSQDRALPPATDMENCVGRDRGGLPRAV
jgi:hypothetical protein